MNLRKNCKKRDETFVIDREHKQQKSHVLSGNLHVKKQHPKNVKTTRGGSWCHVKDQINFPRRYLNENVSGDRFSSTALTIVLHINHEY